LFVPGSSPSKPLVESAKFKSICELLGILRSNTCLLLYLPESILFLSFPTYSFICADNTDLLFSAWGEFDFVQSQQKIFFFSKILSISTQQWHFSVLQRSYE